MEREILSGNEAIARGCYEYGVNVASAYPGTPSTEILENVAKYKEIKSQWSPNEKVAYEVALGAAFAGKRSLVAMKHVGLNVAADPFFTSSYTGVEAGFVVVTADDPFMHSSQNEQDNRNYAKFNKIPMLEPSDSQEAKDFVGRAIEISEQFDTPVLLRITTRIAHSKSIVDLLPRKEKQVEGFPPPKQSKYVTLPMFARKARIRVEERLRKLEEFANSTDLNTIEYNSPKMGIITSGISYQYVKDAFPEASVLKLGLGYPLPFNKIREFAKKVKKLYVVEELDPFIEEQLQANKIKVKGKELLPNVFEFNPALVRNSITKKKSKVKDTVTKLNLPVRPPTFCPGCPHRGIFVVLRELGLRVVGDIGCYTLGALPPISSMDWQISMGGGVSLTLGMEKAWDAETTSNIVGVVGDSTFVHSGITGLIDIVYNKGTATIIILDNFITAMTGIQDHPGTGRTLMREQTHKLIFEDLIHAIGVKKENIRVVDPFDLDETMRVVKEETGKQEPSVIITRRPCVFVDKNKNYVPLEVDRSKCTGCKICLSVGCLAIGFDSKKKKAKIMPELCTGCEICAKLCPVSAFTKKGEHLEYENVHKIKDKRQD